MLKDTDKHHKLFWLYRNLPRNTQGMSLTELTELFLRDCEHANLDAKDNERRNIENALGTLYHIIGNNLCRSPSWEVDNIPGKTPTYHINPNFHLEESIDPQTVLLWQMASQYTANFLPTPIQKTINERLKVIEGKHNKHRKSFANDPLANWQHRIIALPNVTQAPKLDEAILAKLHTALLGGKSIRINYRKKWHDEPQTRIVHPVGLVVMDNMLYLTGFNPCDEYIDSNKMLKAHRNFAVPRILNIEVLDEDVPSWLEREELSLTALYEAGKLEPHGEEKTVKLKLRIQNHACQHLHERPLSDDQTIEPILNADGSDSEWSHLTATVANTLRLEDWLVSMSQLAVVVEPLVLRMLVLDRLKEGVSLYKNS